MKTLAVCAGYDNMEVNLEPVLDYIKAQNYKALEFEQNAKRVASMSKWTVSIFLHLSPVLAPPYSLLEQCCSNQRESVACQMHRELCGGPVLDVRLCCKVWVKSCIGFCHRHGSRDYPKQLRCTEHCQNDAKHVQPV